MRDYSELILDLRRHHCDAKEDDTQEVCEECAYDVIVADKSKFNGITDVCTCGLMHRAADAIEELLARDVVPMDFHERCLQLEIKKRIELEKQLPQWISVDDALPKPESMVLVATKYGGVYYGFLNHSGKFYTANNTLYDSWCWEPDVSHWMPLPKAPEPPEEDE